MCDIGVVRVHLRHTTRLVQVQGSAKMPDKTTAAVWFTEQVLSDKFRQLAKARSFKITEFNEKILEMSRSHHQAVNSGKFCSQCNSLFVGQSKPAQCSRCQHLVHRKCIKDHSTSCNITSDKVDNSSFPNFPPSPAGAELLLNLTTTTTTGSLWWWVSCGNCV